MVPPTKAFIVRSVPELKTWLTRMRIEYEAPVEYVSVIMPDGVYVQYKFMHGREVGFIPMSDVERVDPGGKLYNAVVEGVITNDRFYAVRVCELNGELMHDRVTTNFSVLRNAGFETPETVVSVERSDSEIILLCDHVSSYQHEYKVLGLLVTPNDQRFRQVLALSKNNPEPEIMYINKVEEPPKPESPPVRLKFDFAGRFPPGEKEEALKLIDCKGHWVIPPGSTQIPDYVIVATENLMLAEDNRTAKIKNAHDNNIPMGTLSFLKDLLTTLQ